MSQPVTFAICGCGDRGLDAYAPYQHAAYPPKCASPATRRCSPSPAWPT